MTDAVIRAEGLGKKYLIGHQAERERERYRSLRDVIGRTVTAFTRSARDVIAGRQLVVGDEIEEFWALKDVNFEIKRGEVVGIIGRNGAGKSTLLKILSRITEPSAGRVEIKGRVASLLEVGTGFHPELTGRENIYLNGAILGMTRAEIRRKFDEIVAFAEIEKFLDTPVKRYSSGMYVRLAFAVAAHLEPEILIIDEVLAVGDAEFQKKCLGKMQDVAGLGRTVLFVSHNLSAVRALCHRALCIQSGSIICDANTAAAIREYSAYQKRISKSEFNKVRNVQEGLAIVNARSLCSENRTGERVQIVIDFQAERSGTLSECVVCIFASNGLAGVLEARQSVRLPFSFQPGQFALAVEIAQLPLVDRDYEIGLYLICDGFHGTLSNLMTLEVSPSSNWNSTFSADARGIASLEGKISIYRPTAN
jgi:ABC-type polysaccharide/polyol phosphate transport system ATPase subunit